MIDLTTRETLSENERGEICIRGPQVMKGNYESLPFYQEKLETQKMIVQYKRMMQALN